MNEGETLLAIHLEELGVPFERQYRYVPGRLLCADFAIPELRLLIEVQGWVYTGQAHGSIKGILADLERGNHAALHGWRMMRFSTSDVKCGAAKEWIRAAIEKGENKP